MTAPTRRRYKAAPIKQSLRQNGVLIGCTDTSFAMGVDATTLGGLVVTERIVRGLSDESNPDPNSPGLNLDQLDAVARKLRIDFDVRTRAGWGSLVTELDWNAAVVAQLWYADIGGNAIGHAIYLQRVVDGRAFGVDPIKGAWGSWAVKDVQEAMKHFAQMTGINEGLRWGAFRRAPWTHSNQGPQP